MSVGFLFWLLVILSFIFNVVGAWPNPSADGRWKYLGLGGNVLHFILICLLGIRVFGWPIQG